jgi:hypothetical protein
MGRRRNAARSKSSRLQVETLEDRRLLTVGLISVNSQKTGSGNVASFFSDMSSDGRYVVFRSGATDLVSGITDNNGTGDIFWRDRATGKTELVTKSLAGNQTANQGGSQPILSSNGQFVFFHSSSSDLVPNDNNGKFDVFVRDMFAHTTKLVSVNTSGTTSAADSMLYEVGLTDIQMNGRLISDSGRYVVFASRASDLVADDNNGADDEFVRDIVANKTYLVNRSSAGVPGEQGSGHGVISADGRYVAFEGFSNNLVPNDTNFNRKIFRRDLQTNTTQLVTAGDLRSPFETSTGSYQPKISADGNMIVFATDRLFTNADDTLYDDIYVRDMSKSTPELVSIDHNGQAANYSSFDPAISDDGHHVVFESLASDLVANDNDGNQIANKDVFIRHLASKTTELVSVNAAGTGSGNFESKNIRVSGNGRVVAWLSQATDLVPNYVRNNDGQFEYDLFQRDLGTKKTTLVDARAGTTLQGGDHGAVDPVVSRDGRFISFHSTSTNLITNDLNGRQNDVFVSPGAYSQAAAGVSISPTNGSTVVKEGGQTDTYVIVLNAIPTADVTIQIHPSSQVTVSPTSVKFTRLNWYIAQTIRVTAVNDTVAEPTKTVYITHTEMSTDTRYNGKTLPSIKVQVLDNDTAGGAVASFEASQRERKQPAI